MGVSSTPSKDIFMTFLAHPSGTGFSVDATFQNLFPTVGGISSIHFKPSHEITFYSDDEKPNTCYYTGVIDREGKVEVILVDPYEMEDNRCKELTASYGDNFLNNGVTLDMKSMDAMILGKNGKTDIYTITEGRSDEGYCMGPDNSGRLDCTFKRVEGPANEVSFHLNGKVDIFNDRQERVRCDYIVKDKTDVKLTCPEPTKGMRCLVESLTENVELRRKVGSLELTAEVSNELCWTADTHVYKQVEWEKAFFDFNLERVRDGLTLDATFSADDSSQTIATVAMKDNGDIEFAGGKKKCKCKYRANFNSERGNIDIELLKANSKDCQSLLDGSNKSKGRGGFLRSTLRRSKKSEYHPRIVIVNKAMRRMELHMDNGLTESLSSVNGSKAYIKD